MREYHAIPALLRRRRRRAVSIVVVGINVDRFGLREGGVKINVEMARERRPIIILLINRSKMRP